MAAQLELELGLLATIDVPAPLPERHWYLLRPEHGPVRPPVEAFVDFVRSDEGRGAIERADRPNAPS
jgi:DNA-binding transcriptional LysR family regulator